MARFFNRRFLAALAIVATLAMAAAGGGKFCSRERGKERERQERNGKNKSRLPRFCSPPSPRLHFCAASHTVDAVLRLLVAIRAHRKKGAKPKTDFKQRGSQIKVLLVLNFNHFLLLFQLKRMTAHASTKQTESTMR